MKDNSIDMSLELIEICIIVIGMISFNGYGWLSTEVDSESYLILSCMKYYWMSYTSQNNQIDATIQ